MRPPTCLRSLLPLAACLLAAPLAAQVQEALRLVPRNAQGLVVVPDPAGARTKLAAFLERLQEKPQDPWKELLGEFGLAQLPQESRGLVVAFLPGDGPNGEPAPVLLAVPGDFKAWMKGLKATSKDGQLHRFSSGDHAYLAAMKGNWAMVAKADHAPQLKRAVAAKDSVLGELDELPGWLLEGDAGVVMTPKGLQTATFFAKKGYAEQKAKGLGRGPGAAMEEKLQSYVHQAEREVVLIAARAALDDKGHLTGTLRLRLNPGGAWAGLGRGLTLPDESGLRSLPAISYFMAGGGSLPRAWLSALGELGTLPIRPMLAAAGLKPEQIERFITAQEKTQEGLKGMGMVMPIPGPGSSPMPLIRLDVEDSAASLERQSTFIESLRPLFQEAKLTSPFEIKKIDVEGYPGVLMTTHIGRLMPRPEGAPEGTPEDSEAPEAGGMETGYLAPDAQTLLMGVGGTPALEAAARSYRQAEGRLGDHPDLKATASLLPQRAHLYAFLNLAGAKQAKATARRPLLPPEAPQDFGFPEMPPSPPLGFAFTFDVDRWDLQVVFPGPLQEALGTFDAAEKAAEARQKAAAEAWEKAHPAAPEGPETEEPQE